MASYALSGAADADILRIARGSVAEWGFHRAEAYIVGLHEVFQRLCELPRMGRDTGDVREGYFRLEWGSHVIFYRRLADGILIVRVLHARMDFTRHLS